MGVGTSLKKIFLEDITLLFIFINELLAVSALSLKTLILLFEKLFLNLFPYLYLNSSLFGSV